MAGNKELIDEIVDPVAVKQVADLNKQIQDLEASFVSAAKEAIKLNNATGGATTNSGFAKTAAESSKATKTMIDNAEKTRLAEIKLQQAREKAFDSFERKLQKQTADAQKTSGAYYQLEQAYNAVNKEAKNAAVQFGLTSYQFKEASTQALGLRKRLDEIDQPLGNYKRNVGNYASGFNGLGNSINQLTREFPAFTYSVQTGFMALSNNLPIFFDQIKQTQMSIKAMRAEGQQVPGLFKQLLSSFLSWGTALSVGVTLLTVYGKEIGNFVSSMFKGTEAIDQFAERQKFLSEALKSTDYKTAISNIIELKDEINLAKEGFISKESVVNHYNETIGKTTGLVTSLDEAETALNKNAKAYIQFTYLKAAANLALESASKKALEVEQERLKTPEESANFLDRIRSRLIDNYGSSIEFDPDAEKKVKASVAKRGKQRNEAVISQGEKDLKDLEKVFTNLNKQAADIAKTNNFDFFGGGDEEERRKKREEDAKKAAEKAKKAAEDALKLAQEQAKELMDLRNEYDKQIADAQERGVKAEVDRLKRELKEKEDLLSESNNKRLLENDQYANEAYNLLVDRYKQGLITTKEFEDGRQIIEQESALQSIDSAIKLSEDLIAIQKSYGANTQSEEDKLARLKLSRSKLVRDGVVADLKTEEEKRKELNEAIKKLAYEAAGFLTSLVDAGFENRKNKIQEEINLVDERSKAEIDAVNKSLISTADKADKVKLIEAQAAAQKAQLQREQRRQDIEKAKFDRAIAIARIVAENAINIVKYGLTPLSVIAAAIGAFQIAQVLATPIPAYEKGTKNAKGGISLVGEKGAEYVITPQGATFLTPGKPTLMDIPKGSTVIPHLQTVKVMDVKNYAGGQATDMSEVVRAIERNRPVKSKTVIGGWRKEHSASAQWEQRKNQYFN